MATDKTLRTIRPRLDAKELRFLVHALTEYETVLTLKANELKAERAKLSNLKAEAIICRDFIRRFQQLLKGKKPRPSWLATSYLQELTL